jgi:hypothetical protein
MAPVNVNVDAAVFQDVGDKRFVHKLGSLAPEKRAYSFNEVTPAGKTLPMQSNTPIVLLY